MHDANADTPTLGMIVPFTWQASLELNAQLIRRWDRAIWIKQLYVPLKAQEFTHQNRHLNLKILIRYMEC